MNRLVPALVIAAAGIAAVGSSLAQTWPTKPLRLVIPFPAGGGPERSIRALALGLQQRLGQPVVVDYKPGAAGNLGAAETARAPADGYTWMFAQESLTTINPHIYRNLGYDQRNLVPVALIGSFVNVLTCNPSVGVKTLQDLVAKAKATPGSIAYASSGPGSPGHLTMEMFQAAAGVTMNHVAYKGPMPAVQDLLGGHVQCGFLVAAIVADHVKSGKLVALAGSGTKPPPTMPNLPSISSAYPDVNATFWLGIFAPLGVDPAVFRKFHSALVATVKSKEVQEAMLTTDTQPETSTSEEAQRELEKISIRWGDIVKRIGLKVD